MDKEYYDYDYSEPKESEEKNFAEMANSDEELKDKLKRIGIKVRRAKNESAEDLQRIAMSERESEVTVQD